MRTVSFGVIHPSNCATIGVLFCAIAMGCNPGPTALQNVIAEGAELMTEEQRETAVSKIKCGDLLRFLAEDWNGLRSEVVDAHGQRIEAEYRPRVLHACMEAQPELLLADLVEGPEGLDMWLLRMPRSGMMDGADPGPDLSPYLASSAQHDLFEIIGNDTIPCAFWHLESTPSVGPHHQLLVGFDVALDERDRFLLWKGRPDSHSEDLRFRLKPGAFAVCARIAVLMKEPNGHDA